MNRKSRSIEDTDVFHADKQGDGESGAELEGLKSVIDKMKILKIKIRNSGKANGESRSKAGQSAAEDAAAKNHVNKPSLKSTVVEDSGKVLDKPRVLPPEEIEGVEEEAGGDFVNTGETDPSRLHAVTPEHLNDDFRPDDENPDDHFEMKQLSPDEIMDHNDSDSSDDFVNYLDSVPLQPADPATLKSDFTDDSTDVLEDSQENEDFEFLTPEEMASRKLGVSAGELLTGSSMEPECKGNDEERLYLTPDEMIARKQRREYHREEEESPKKTGILDSLPKLADLMEYLGDRRPMALEDNDRKSETIEEKIVKYFQASEEDNEYLTPEEVFARQKHPPKRKPRKLNQKVSLLNIDSLMSIPLEEEREAVLKDFKDEPVLDKVEQLSLFELAESDVLEDGEEYVGGSGSETGKEPRQEHKQLDLKPILKKKDIDSPLDLLDPLELEEEEEFVSNALLKDTVVKDRFKVLKVINEKCNRNTYMAKDIKATGKKYILKEIILPPMDKEEYRKRRDKFRDTIRIISTFKHPNLSIVYEGFSQNNREYSYMEKIDGLDMEKLAGMNVKNFSEKEVIDWGSQLCEAVKFMHYRPVPFTLGDLRPHHIMFDDSGKIRLTGYDLQRFFNTDRTLEFLPDDPTKLYGDVTKVARILYFLLTKEHYDENAFELEWPSNVSPKMQKLLETACRKGQKTYGDIKVFHNKLLDTQIVDEEETIRRSFRFPKIKIDFSWVGNLGRALASQRPTMIILEIFAIVVLLLFVFSQKTAKEKVTEFQSPGGPITWLTAVDELNLYNANDFNPLFRKRLGRKVSAMLPVTVSVKPPGKDKEEFKQAILMGFEGSSRLELIDTNDLKSLGFIQNEMSPSKMLFDKESGLVYILHKGRGCITLVDLNIQKTVDMFLVGNRPVDLALVPLSRQEKLVKSRIMALREKNPEKFKKKKSMIPRRTIIVSNSGSCDLMILDANKGYLKGSVAVNGCPGQIEVSKVLNKIYLIEMSKSDLLVIDMERLEVEKKIHIPGENPSAMTLDPVKFQLWISMSQSNSISVIDPFKEKTNEIKGFGNLPKDLIFDRDAYKVWVLNQGTKDVAILDARSFEILKRIDLGKSPSAICIEGHRYFGGSSVLTGQNVSSPSLFGDGFKQVKGLSLLINPERHLFRKTRSKEYIK